LPQATVEPQASRPGWLSPCKAIVIGSVCRQLRLRHDARLPKYHRRDMPGFSTVQNHPQDEHWQKQYWCSGQCRHFGGLLVTQYSAFSSLLLPFLNWNGSPSDLGHRNAALCESPTYCLGIGRAGPPVAKDQDADRCCDKHGQMEQENDERRQCGPVIRTERL